MCHDYGYHQLDNIPFRRLFMTKCRQFFTLPLSFHFPLFTENKYENCHFVAFNNRDTYVHTAYCILHLLCIIKQYHHITFTYNKHWKYKTKYLPLMLNGWRMIYWQILSIFIACGSIHSHLMSYTIRSKLEARS